MPGTATKALYPDMGVAAMLQNMWGEEAGFAIASVNDRKPLTDEDELVVFAAPDPMSKSQHGAEAGATR